MKQLIRERIQESIEVKISLAETQLGVIEAATNAILKAFRKNKKILIFGNGGSAADAQHIATEFICRFQKNRKSLPAIALTTDTSALTAISNDYGFAAVFSRQLEGLANPGDVVIGISTSGKSANVLKAFQTAKQKKAITIALTGSQGKSLSRKVDYCLVVPSRVTARIQESHITILHIICELVENELFST